MNVDDIRYIQEHTMDIYDSSSKNSEHMRQDVYNALMTNASFVEIAKHVASLINVDEISKQMLFGT